MNKFSDMQLLSAVVEKGNFAQAAQAVDLTPAMVGRRIAAMEKDIGFMLFNRSTRRMELTPGGTAYYEGCLRILADVQALEESVTSAHQSRPTGLIRLTAPDGLGSPFLINLIKTFRQKYPDIRFDLNLSSTPLDLVKEKIDLSIRVAFELDDSSMVATKIGSTTFGLYASEDYLEARGKPTCRDALKQHDCLHFGGSKYGDYWTAMEDGKQVNFRQQWALVLPNTQCLIQACAAGMGIAMIPELFARPSVATGELTPLTGIMTFPTPSIYGIYPTRKHLPYRVKLFLDFLRQHGPEMLS